MSEGTKIVDNLNSYVTENKDCWCIWIYMSEETKIADVPEFFLQKCPTFVLIVDVSDRKRNVIGWMSFPVPAADKQ